MQYLFLCLLLCQPSTTRPAQAPPVELSYQEAMAESVRTTKPLVVYVGKDGQALDCAVVTFSKTLEGYPKECTVVSRPEKDGNVYWVATISSRASRDDIIKSLSKKEVRAASQEPFRLVQQTRSIQNCST